MAVGKRRELNISTCNSQGIISWTFPVIFPSEFKPLVASFSAKDKRDDGKKPRAQSPRSLSTSSYPKGGDVSYDILQPVQNRPTKSNRSRWRCHLTPILHSSHHVTPSAYLYNRMLSHPAHAIIKCRSKLYASPPDG